MITLDVAHEKLELAMENLVKKPQIKWISTTTGRFDIIAIAQFSSTVRLSDFLTKELAQIEGLNSSETFVCLDVKKGQYMQLSEFA